MSALASLATPDDVEVGSAAWYAQRWERARRLAGHLLGDWADAEDVASEVLLRVWARWERHGLPDNPDAYVARALRNEVVNRFRRRDRERRSLALSRVPTDVAGPEDHTAERDHVDRLLRHLTPADRDTVVAHYLDDRSCEDIADELALAPASVRARLHRSRRRLAALPHG
ncbi:RNA polymerase sigma factor [Egicoccus sp. AB-alg2]|uniref:RNA polymerase sigma factor n=1 Tax=Egicoccus sp. AB-alg2 TaxID=3242693 RepID=UPI00359D2910